jgi:hypothetical protein
MNAEVPMMRVLSATLLLLLAAPLFAADYEGGIRYVSLSPIGEVRFDGGEIDVVSSRGFGANAEVFWWDRVSTQAAATFLNPAAFLYPEAPPRSDIDLGTLGIDIYSLSARYHFRPRSRVATFAGAGAAYVVLGDLEDRFGDHLEMRFARQTAFFAEGGVRYRFRRNVFLDVTVSYMPLEAKRSFVRNDDPRGLALPETIRLDPATVSVGAAWRF